MKIQNPHSFLNKFKKPFTFSLIILPFAVIGGYFIGVYIFETSNEEAKSEIIRKVHNLRNFCLLTALQSSIYGLFCSFVGYIISESIGLMRPVRFDQKTLLKTGISTLFCGVLFSSDYFIFAPLIPQLQDFYSKGINFANFISALTYGGIVEEVIMRLFLMSLFSFILWKQFARKYSKEIIPSWIFITSNVICAILFAALHLPSTVTMFGKLTPLLIFRCFFLNGAFGLVFGRFYRKYGIQYSFLGHAGIHFISKVIWLIVL